MSEHVFKYLGTNTDVRLCSDAIEIGANVTIDDDVRIVVPETGRLIIGNNVKIGKGSVLNCGGSLTIAPEVAIYGYCYIQTSRWHWAKIGDGGAVKQYSYFDITLGLRTVLAPFTTVVGTIATPEYFESSPNQIVGEW